VVHGERGTSRLHHTGRLIRFFFCLCFFNARLLVGLEETYYVRV